MDIGLQKKRLEFVVTLKKLIGLIALKFIIKAC